MDIDLLVAQQSDMAANQFRILLSGLAYTLFEGLRRMALGDTELAHASPDRIRLTLLRIGAVVIRNTRRIRFPLSSTCPYRELFRTVDADEYPSVV